MTSSELVGKTLGQYRILGVIERNLVTVYKARLVPLGVDRALRVLPAQAGTDEHPVACFQHEAKVLVRLNHPNILRICDFGEMNGAFYMATEYVDGSSLYFLLAAGPLKPGTVQSVLEHTASALDYVHSYGIIHRNVTPAAILIGTADRVVLTDFSLARSMEATRLTSQGFVVGTPGYIAPERIQGQDEPRSDLYSLGVVLFEMLTGRRPFEGDAQALLWAHMHQAPPPVRQFAPALPPQVEPVLQRALAKSPDERFQTAQDLATACAAALRTGSAGTPGTMSRAKRFRAPWVSRLFSRVRRRPGPSVIGRMRE